MQALLQPLFVITLDNARELYTLTDDEIEELLKWLYGRERRLASGGIGWYVKDVEAAVSAMRKEQG